MTALDPGFIRQMAQLSTIHGSGEKIHPQNARATHDYADETATSGL